MKSWPLEGGQERTKDSTKVASSDKDIFSEGLQRYRSIVAKDGAVEGFVNYLTNEKQSSEKTIEGYFQDIAQFIQIIQEVSPGEAGGSCAWDAVTEAQARRYVATLSRCGEAPTSVNR